MGGNGRRSTVFIAANSDMQLPTNYFEPTYSETSAVQIHRANRLEPLQRTDTQFLHVLPSPLSSADQTMMGQRAARFDLSRVELLLDKRPDKASRFPWNPIVLTRREGANSVIVNLNAF